MAYLRIPEGMFYINPISNIHIRYTHTYIHFIFRMLYALTMSPLAIYADSIFIYNVKNGKNGGRELLHL